MANGRRLLAVLGGTLAGWSLGGLLDAIVVPGGPQVIFSGVGLGLGLGLLTAACIRQ